MMMARANRGRTRLRVRPFVTHRWLQIPMPDSPDEPQPHHAASLCGVSPAALRIVRQLVGRPPQSMDELVQATGVTRTAVTEQLQHLLDAGYVSRTAERVGRGRPRHLFSATPEALQGLFRNNQRTLAPLLMRSLLEVAGPETASRVLEHVSGQLAQHYLTRMDDSADRLSRARQLVDLLRQEGILVDVQVDGDRLRIHERTCPFVDVANDQRTICTVERQMMTVVLGATVEATACRLDGCAGCTFEIRAESPVGQLAKT